MKTIHKVFFQDARNMNSVPSDSVDLVVTSPPYPMIEMWDEIFSNQDPAIEEALAKGEGEEAFDLMHKCLEPVWDEIYRVLKDGRFACINIGDATRKVDGNFCLYSNHSKILCYFLNLGFSSLPDILWRKQTNAPNKFMGSGMLPAGAYVTLEHEYILIFRKSSKRIFRTPDEKRNRHESAIFWEERNAWYSDIWLDVKGTGQVLSDKKSRLRSAAYPFEFAFRLISMYSVRGDVVLDPFLGTGTTVAAAMATGRNSVGVEIDPNLRESIYSIVPEIVEFSNRHIRDRIEKHLAFVDDGLRSEKPPKHVNNPYGFPVVTSQERQLIFYDLDGVEEIGSGIFEIGYAASLQGVFRCIIPSLR